MSPPCVVPSPGSKRTKISKKWTVPTLHSARWRWRRRRRRIWFRRTFLSGVYWILWDSLQLTKITPPYVVPTPGSKRTKISKKCTVPTLHSARWRLRRRRRRIWFRWTFLSGVYWTQGGRLHLTKMLWPYVLPSLGSGWHYMWYKCTAPAAGSAAAWGRPSPRAAIALNRAVSNIINKTYNPLSGLPKQQFRYKVAWTKNWIKSARLSASPCILRFWLYYSYL
jgi:hypothetical protein